MKVSQKMIPLTFAVLWLGTLCAQDISEQANVFLQSLSEDLKAETLFPLDDTERYNWHFVPIQRKGPTFHDFSDNQKKAALALLAASLSKEGLEKTTEIRELEKVLVIIENNSFKMPDGSDARDPLNYHFCIFGNPSPDTFWGWRFEGHHISLNFTSGDGNILSSTPSFLGSNPGVVKIEEQRGKEVLNKESDYGFELVNSLDDAQLTKARFDSQAPQEILTGNNRKANGVEKLGIPYTSLKTEQKEIFMKLLEVYIGNYIFEFSETFRKKIVTAGLENLFFAWAGGLKEGTAHYYRIHGPTLLIEFDNIQNDANHVHTVVRDLTNDFAEDLLMKHYQLEHQKM